MKKTPFVFASFLTGLLTVSATAQVFVGSDDFNSGLTIPNNNWDYGQHFSISDTNGLLSVSTSRLDFTKDAGAGNYDLGWNNDHSTSTAGSVVSASFTTSWQMDMTVTNTLGNAGSEFGVIGFQVTDSDGNYYAQMLSSTQGGNFFRTEGTGVTAVNPTAMDTTDVFLRMAWDANAQALSTYYSVDGSSYTLSDTFNPVGTWDAGPSAGFWFEVFGNSDMASAISVGSVYADNFSISAVPEPSTYAAFAGLAALGLAAWRKRFAART